MTGTIGERGGAAPLESTGPERTYLAVPFAEKDEAKALGARWDTHAKCWYVPLGVEPAPFDRWRQQQAWSIHTNPVDEFAEALAIMGLTLKGAPIMDGCLHRVAVEGDKPGQKSGAYVGHLDGHPGGFIQNFKSGAKRNWKSATPVAVRRAADRARLVEESAMRRAEREREFQAIHDQVVRLIAAHLADAPPPPADHPYLARKGVAGYGIFHDVAGPLEISGGREDPQKWSARGNLLVPICAIDGQLLSAESIDAEGRKMFPRGARWHGGSHQIGAFAGDTIVIVEGYATGATIHQATGLPVAVAFHAGNLEAVATAFRAVHPDALIIIAGDNDHQRPREFGADGRPKANVGREAAERAANAVGGFPLLPAFAADDPGTDWNDIAVAKGETDFATAWQAGMAVAERHFEVMRIAAERENAQIPAAMRTGNAAQTVRGR